MTDVIIYIHLSNYWYIKNVSHNSSDCIYDKNENILYLARENLPDSDYIRY